MDAIKVANQLKRAGKLEQAIAKYHQIIKFNPNFYSAYYELGTALVKQGNLEDGINQLKLALEVNPNSALCYYSLGELSFQQGELTEAVKYYRQAIKTNPNYYRFYYSLANTLAQVGDLQAANDTYQQALRLNPDLGSINGVQTLVNKVVEKSPKVQYLQLIFGDIATAKKELDIEQANDWLELYTQVNKSNSIRFLSAKAQEKKLAFSNSLVAHYRSDGEKIVIGGGKEMRVCFIQDESGNGNHLIQSQLQKMPIWKVDRLNNQEIITFTSKGQTVLKSSNNLTIAKPQISWFTVFTPGIEYGNNKKLPHGAVFRAEVNNFPGFYGTFIGNKNGFYDLCANCRSGEKTFHSINHSKFSPGEVYLVTAIWDGVGNKFVLRINGCVEGEINDVVPTVNFNHGKISVGADTNNKHGFNGEFYELILYESVLELDDVVEVEKYLCQKWGIEHPGFKIDDLYSKISKNPHFSWSYYYLGEYLEKTGYLEEAAQNYLQATELNKASACIQNKYGKIIGRLGNDLTKGLDYLLLVLNQSKNIPNRFYADIIDALAQSGKVDKSIKVYQHFLGKKFSLKSNLQTKLRDLVRQFYQQRTKLFWENQSVIFVGPLQHNLSKEAIEKYDIVIRSNNFFGMKEDDLVSSRCDVLIVNKLFYESSYFSKQLEQIKPKVKLLLVYDFFLNHAIDTFIDSNLVIDSFSSQKNNRLSYFQRFPLLLTRLLDYLIPHSFQQLYITGINFFQGSKETDFWRKSYILPEHYKFNILKGDKNVHNTDDDMLFLQETINRDSRIEVDDTVSNILDSFTVNKQKYLQKYLVSHNQKVSSFNIKSSTEITTNEIIENGLVVVKGFFSKQDLFNFQTEVLELLKSIDFQSERILNGSISDKIVFNTDRKIKGFEEARKTTLSSEKALINKRLARHDGDEGLIDIWGVDRVLSTKTFIEKINQFSLNLVSKAFQSKYKLYTNHLYFNKSIITTRGIHADSNFYPSRMKSFLYLTDIKDIFDGPFSYILKSHQKEGLKYHRKYDIYLPETQEDRDNYVIFDNLQAGDLIVGCVSGAHRGMPQLKGRERVVIVSSYDPE